jgi:hypothetical protein
MARVPGGEVTVGRSAEGLPEVAELDVREVLDEPEQGASRFVPVGVSGRRTSSSDSPSSFHSTASRWDWRVCTNHASGSRAGCVLGIETAWQGRPGEPIGWAP